VGHVTNPAGMSVLSAHTGQTALLNLHRALEFDELWGALQGLFENLVPHDTLVMSVNYLDWKSEASTKRLSSEKSRHPHDEHASLMVANEGRSFFQPFLDAHHGIGAYQHSQLAADPRKIPQHAYYRRYMSRYDWRYSAHLLFWQGRGVETSFALRRRADQGDFTAQEMGVLQAIHPHIKVAFDRMKIFEQERQRRRLLERFYRAKPDAVLFLDWDGQPIYASQEALALCATWNLGADRARHYTPQAVFAIPEEIRRACDELQREWQTRGPETVAAGRALPERHVAAAQPGYEALVTLRPEKNGTLTKPVFVVRLRLREAAPASPLTAATPEPANERLLHLLSPAERELAQLVCAGLTNKEIATELRKTEGSVKVQLSAIFQKLRVTSRAKLIVALR
jgi:DNA-binding CsgD family transcriptional regulator/PAS domain-containing protein